MSEPAYYKLKEAIMEAEADEKIKKAGNRVTEHIFRENNQVGSDELVDAAISFDGTWAKRGFTSLIVVFVIIVYTGEVLDYHVLSKECRKCTQKKEFI